MPEYGGDGETPVEEGKYEDPIMAFPGHWVPNDLIFYNHNHFPEQYKDGAFIAFHGSWNRAPEPQEGYKVVFVPFSGETPSGDYEEFATGFPDSENPQPGSAEHRPTGLAQGPDGTLYITDSQKRKIWRIVYTGTGQQYLKNIYCPKQIYFSLGFLFAGYYSFQTKISLYT